MWQIACELRGGEEALRDKPYFIMYGEPVSPLRHASEVLDKLLFCADKGIPAIYSPAPSAGATAPITQAGHIVLAVAESLFGLVIHQLRKPGAPFVFGMGPVKIDMTTVQALYNSAEYYTTILGICEMAKWLDLPNWGYAGSSDSHVVDAQAGMDAAELTLLSMQAGSNLNHDIGYLAFGLIGALELVVITDEIISLNRRTLEGIEVSPETLGVEVIAKVGPGGEFLREKHTAKYVRSQQWMPTMLNRKTRENWKADGSPDLRERARRKALAILADHKPEPIARRHHGEGRPAHRRVPAGFVTQRAPCAPAGRRPARAASRGRKDRRRCPGERRRGLDAIHEAALRLLAEVGCAVLEPEALALFRRSRRRRRRRACAPQRGARHRRAGDGAGRLYGSRPAPRRRPGGGRRRRAGVSHAVGPGLRARPRRAAARRVWPTYATPWPSPTSHQPRRLRPRHRGPRRARGAAARRPSPTRRITGTDKAVARSTSRTRLELQVALDVAEILYGADWHDQAAPVDGHQHDLAAAALARRRAARCCAWRALASPSA